MQKYLIIGLGWLGSPLAKRLLSLEEHSTEDSGAAVHSAGDSGAREHSTEDSSTGVHSTRHSGAGVHNARNHVAGTTRSADKAQKLSEDGIDTYLFDLYENTGKMLASTLFQNAKVVINIPPGRNNFNPDLFTTRMKSLMAYAVEHGAEHICFISTTSVFAGLNGKITNESALSPHTASGNAHVELELYFKDLVATHKIRGSVMRLAGLVGEDRHPIRTLSQKSNIALGKNPVNLVHQQDVIQAVMAVINSPSVPKFYAANLCSADHPSREQYYTWCAEQTGSRLPEFAPDTRDTIDGKWVDASDTVAKLKITLAYPSPYSMLCDSP